MHLIVDGYEGDAQRLKDVDFIHRFLDEYPTAIGMTKITPPHVYTYVGPTTQDWGVSGFVLIAESHISVHTFPDRRYLNIDVFSCKEFDAEAAVAQLREHFGIERVRFWVLNRGLEHLNLPEAAEALNAQRGQLARTLGG